MTKRIISLLATAFLLPAALFATAQEPETLVYKGQENEMFATPLESYFSDQNPRPNELLSSLRTSNWRGYNGSWKIESDSLYLTQLEHEIYIASENDDKDGSYKESVIPADQIFGEGREYPIMAEWFTGQLKIPQGELVQYVHMGFGSQYERTIILDIENGKVLKETTVEYNAEKDAYRSQPDLEWVALGDEPKLSIEENISWIDGRLIPTPVVYGLIESGEIFKTRGIFFQGKDNDSYLWIPETPKTQSDHLPLNRIPESTAANGSHVEVTAHFYKLEGNEGYGLKATEIRSLSPGETIHNPNYAEIWADFQNWLKEQQAKQSSEAAQEADTNQPSDN